jgi:hypothetical protein
LHAAVIFLCWFVFAGVAFFVWVLHAVVDSSCLSCFCWGCLLWLSVACSIFLVLICFCWGCYLCLSVACCCSLLAFICFCWGCLTNYCMLLYTLFADLLLQALLPLSACCMLL